MAFLPAAVIDGALTWAQGIRQISYLAADGMSGVLSPSDMLVTALPTPGPGVNIGAGSGVIVSTYPGAAGQAYNITNDATVFRSIPTNSSGGTVTRRVMVAVRDPQYPLMQVPAEPMTDLYLDPLAELVFPTDRPYLHLADVTMPAGASTILPGMITPRAALLQQRMMSDAMPYFPGTVKTMPTSYGNWPDIPHTVGIPSWCTYFWAKATINGFGYTGTGASRAGVRLSLAGTPDLQNGIITGNVDTQRQAAMFVGRWNVAAGIRGTTQPLILEGMRSAGTGEFFVDNQSQVIFEWTAQERR